MSMTSDSDVDVLANGSTEIPNSTDSSVCSSNAMSVTVSVSLTDSPPPLPKGRRTSRNGFETGGNQRRSYEGRPSWGRRSFPFEAEDLQTAERVMMPLRDVPQYMDTHCHIDFILNDSNKATWSEIKESYSVLKPRNFSHIMQVFCDPRRFSLKDNVLKQLEVEDNIYFSFGCHPKRIDAMDDEHFDGLRQCLSHPKVRAFGEIGLDYSQDFFLQARRQQMILRKQLHLAMEFGLPLVLHCREGQSAQCDLDADEDLISILKEIVPRDHHIHLHCFTRDYARAERWLTTFPNLCIGLTPLVNNRHGNDGIVEVAQMVPLDRLLLETDAPFFVPQEIGRRSLPHSLPWFSVFVAQRIAELRDIALDTVIRITYFNARKLYKL